jgi:hypothetical protein
MKHVLRDFTFVKVLGIGLGFCIAISFCGCATPPPGGGGTAELEHSDVQGRDLGRGGATSGGVSSIDPAGNAADYSIYDAQQLGYR